MSKIKRFIFTICMPEHLREHLENVILQVSEETGRNITMTQAICQCLCDYFKIPRIPDSEFRERRKNVSVRKISKDKDKLTAIEAAAYDMYMAFRDNPAAQSKMLASPKGPVIESALRKLGI